MAVTDISDHQARAKHERFSHMADLEDHVTDIGGCISALLILYGECGRNDEALGYLLTQLIRHHRDLHDAMFPASKKQH